MLGSQEPEFRSQNSEVIYSSFVYSSFVLRLAKRFVIRLPSSVLTAWPLHKSPSTTKPRPDYLLQESKS